MAKGLKYLLPILLLVLGCSVFEDILNSLGHVADKWDCTLIDDDGEVALWGGDDCETGKTCFSSYCPMPGASSGGRGVLVCEYDEADEINVCSCSCDLDD